jgi:hypothetical protein
MVSLVLIPNLGTNIFSLILYLLFMDGTTHKFQHDAHFIEELFIFKYVS